MKIRRIQKISNKRHPKNRLKCKFSFYFYFILQQKLCKAFRRHIPHIRAIFKNTLHGLSNKIFFWKHQQVSDACACMFVKKKKRKKERLKTKLQKKEKWAAEIGMRTQQQAEDGGTAEDDRGKGKTGWKRRKARRGLAIGYL